MHPIDEDFNKLKSILERASAWLLGSPEEQAKKEASSRNFSSLEEYKQKSGKRFRRTKDELAMGLSPEEAFFSRYLK